LLKRLTQHPWFHSLQLLLWIGIGAVLRFTELTAKPLWTDEFATIVFSLGQSFQTIPLSQVIDTATLLQPLQIQTIGTSSDVVTHLMSESTHPPLYFLLTNLWLHLGFGMFPGLYATDGWVSVAAARSLPALLGVLSIPAMFTLGWVATRSRWVAQVAAALMAVSPFGIALAQEARHYTFAVLWVIASLTCFTIALRHLSTRSTLPIAIGLLWVVVNTLGMATHYFFALTLIAEGLTLLALWRFSPNRFSTPQSPSVLALIWVALGTAAGMLVWLPALQASRDREIAQWIYGNESGEFPWFDPIAHLIASLVTMLTLLPVQASAPPLVIAAGAGLLLFSIWLSWLVGRGLTQQSSDKWLTWGLLGLIGSAIGCLLLLEYGLGTDLTQGLRYNFVYFPAVPLLVAIGLAAQKNLKLVAIVLTAGLVGSLTVGFHLGLQKVHRPDQVVSRIESRPQTPIVIAIAHHTHGQTGRLMGLAWELRRSGREAQFYLDHQPCNAADRDRCDRPTPALRQTIAQLPRPVDLWLINFQAQARFTDLGCKFDRRLRTRRVDGYKYQRYRCRDAKQ
jgi:uncharacterized membrane protein